jgi:Crinkler effector protein N-terminal domain
MVKMFCSLVGQKGSAFSIKIKENNLVVDLKDAIKRKKERTITCDADNLQLFLGKQSEVTWLDSSTNDVEKLKNGEINALINDLTHEAKELREEFGLDKVLEGMPVPKTKEIHILVVVPEVDQGQWGKERTRKKARTRTTALDIPCEDPFFKNIRTATERNGWISFQENIPSTTLKNLYIRESFRTIASEISLGITSKKAIITGTPGIGKSLFLIYLLFKFVKERKRVLIIYHPSNIYYDENGNVFEFNHGDFPPTYDYSFWNDSLWCLFASKFKDKTQLGALPIGRCMFILSTSPRREMLNDFRKPPDPQVYYMPTWTKGELKMISPFFPNANKWRNRFKLLGGIPRHVFECTQQNPTEMLKAACMECSLDDCVQIVGLNSTITENLLIHISSTPPYTNFSVNYASQTALDIIVQNKGVEAKRNMLSLLQSCNGNPLTSVLCRYIFKQYAIELLEQGGTFSCRQLVHGNVKENPIGTTLCIQSSIKTVVDKVLPNQPLNQLHVPKTSNYAAFDAWIPGIGAFQMTVRKTHTIRNGAKKDLAMLKGGNRLYWLLPPLYYNSFTTKSPDDIEQHAILIPYPNVP